MKPLHAVGGMLVALASAGCNTSDVTKNRTVPPIAGVVGGPDQPGGQGSVALEIQADAASAVPGSSIVVENLSREVDPGVETVPGGTAFVHLVVKGDVGDELRVTVEHPDEGEISRAFMVEGPRLEEVRDPDGPEPVIHAGVAAQISGSGFCVAPACNLVLFDGTAIETIEEPRPGLLYFPVPAEADPGTHTVRVAIAGTEGGDATYLSPPFSVTLE